MYFKGVNLLPTLKETEIKNFSSWSKKIIMYLVWLLAIILVNVAFYIPVSLEKVQLINLKKKKQQITTQLMQDKEKYIKYHNIVFRLQIIENLQQSRFYLTSLVKAVDQTVYPSTAKQYTIHKDGSVSIGLTTDSFLKASISWHKLLVKNDLFKSLNLRSFSQQNENVPFVLKGQVNLDKLKEH